MNPQASSSPDPMGTDSLGAYPKNLNRQIHGLRGFSTLAVFVYHVYGMGTLWNFWPASLNPVAPFFAANTGRVADALLAITDAKASRAKSAVVKGTYEKLRGSAKKNVEAAVPRLGKLIESHTS